MMEVLEKIVQGAQHAGVKEEQPVRKNVMLPSEFRSGVEQIDYVWHRILRKGWLYAMTGVPGTGKTAVALSMAFALIQGLKFQGRQTAKSRVLYLSGENPDDVRLRFEMMLNKAGMGWDEVEDDICFTHHPFAIDNADQMQKFADEVNMLGKFDVMFIDTGTAHSEAEDENDNREMHKLAIAMRCFMDKVGNPATIPLMHPIKNAPKDNLLPRGGGAFTGSIDGVLCLWREGEGSLVEMFAHADKWRGQRFKHMFFEIETLEHPTIIDNFGYRATTCVAVETPDPAEKEEVLREEVGVMLKSLEEEHLEKIVEIIKRKDSHRERVTTNEQGRTTTHSVLSLDDDFPTEVDSKRLNALMQKLTRSGRVVKTNVRHNSKNKEIYTITPSIWMQTQEK